MGGYIDFIVQSGTLADATKVHKQVLYEFNFRELVFKRSLQICSVKHKKTEIK